jgi:hypothetical protein
MSSVAALEATVTPEVAELVFSIVIYIPIL